MAAEASDPDPLRIEVIERRRLEISWSDGAVTRLSAPELRALCPCAGCREAPEQQADGAYASATIDAAALVGGYAVNFTFGPDGHRAGIFPFPELRRHASG